MIDAAKIEELRGLDAAATPGPWKWDGDVCDGSQDYRDQNAPWLVTDDLLEVPILRGDITGSRDADAALIVAMRNALPSLLDLAASRACVGEDGGYDYVMAAETLCNGIQVWGSGTAFDKCREALQAAFEAGRDKASTRIRALASEKEGLRRERDEARERNGKLALQLRDEKLKRVLPPSALLARAESAESQLSALRAENERLRKALEPVIEIAARNESSPVILRARSELEAGHE